MKKIIALALTVLIALSCLTACGKAPSGTEAGKEIKVGICNYVDDASLNQIVDNIQSRLKEIGEENGVTFNVSYDNCNADANLMNQIISNFIADGVDIMVGVANLMFAAKPDTAKVALLYDIGQDSSATPIAAAKADLDARGVAYSDYTGTTVDEVVLAVQSLIADGVDAVFTPTDNTIMKAELSICELLSDAGIPHYTGADSFALNGAFLGYGVDYANLGVETANMVAEVALEGKKPAELPVRTFDNGCATVNTDTCEKLGYKFDDIETAFAPFCTKVQSIVTAESFDELN